MEKKLSLCVQINSWIQSKTKSRLQATGTRTPITDGQLVLPATTIRKNQLQPFSILGSTYYTQDSESLDSELEKAALVSTTPLPGKGKEFDWQPQYTAYGGGGFSPIGNFYMW